MDRQVGRWKVTGLSDLGREVKGACVLDKVGAEALDPHSCGVGEERG